MIQVPSSLPGRLVPVDQTAPTADNHPHHNTATVNLTLQPTKIQWRASCRDPLPPEFQDKIKLSAVWTTNGDIESSPVLGEASTEKTSQRFQRIATTLADLNAGGLNAHTLLTMYVGAASQHVLRMSFVPEQEARNFDRQVTTFWFHLIQRDITSQLFFFLLFKLGGLGVGSAVQRHAAAPWRAWQSIITTSMATTQSSSTQHHHYELNWHNSKPPFHYI